MALPSDLHGPPKPPDESYVSGGARHETALFRTIEANGGALLAVLHFMLNAFFAAGLANISAERTNFGCMHAVTRHRRCGKGTGLGAVDVQRNALDHHFHVVFLQAGRRTVVAFCSAVIAGLQAIGKLFLHVKSFFPGAAGVNDMPRQDRAEK